MRKHVFRMNLDQNFKKNAVHVSGNSQSNLAVNSQPSNGIFSGKNTTI